MSRYHWISGMLIASVLAGASDPRGTEPSERFVTPDEFLAWLSSPQSNGKGKTVTYFNQMPNGHKGDFLGEFGADLCTVPKSLARTHDHYVVMYAIRTFSSAPLTYTDGIAETIVKHGCPGTILKVRGPGGSDQSLNRALDKVYPADSKLTLNQGASWTTWSAIHDSTGAARRTFPNMFFTDQKLD